MQPTITDTGEHDEKSFQVQLYVDERQTKHRELRRHDGEICSGSCDVLSLQENNWTRHPCSNWVTVSDGAFLVLCLGNYEKTWCAKKLRVNKGPPPPSGHEVEESIPEPRYSTGKVIGHSKAGQRKE